MLTGFSSSLGSSVRDRDAQGDGNLAKATGEFAVCLLFCFIFDEGGEITDRQCDFVNIGSSQH